MVRKGVGFILVLLLISLLVPLQSVSASATTDVKILYVDPIPQSPTSIHSGCNTSGKCEMMAIVNVGTTSYDISSWQLGRTSNRTQFPSGTTIAPGQKIFVADYVPYFVDYWGFKPNFEYGGDSDPTVPQMLGTIPFLSDTGDTILLQTNTAALVDKLVYGSASASTGWTGASAQLWDKFPVRKQKQVLARKVNESGTGYVADTNTANDWGQGSTPNYHRLTYEGQSDFRASSVTGSATVTAIAAPDNSGVYLRNVINSATKSLVMVGYEFNNDLLADSVISAMKRGVTVTLFLERNMCCTNTIDDQSRYVHRRIDQDSSGKGQVWYMYDWDGDFSSRYNAFHNKYIIVDDSSVIVGSENYSPGGYSGVTNWGNRGWMVHVQNNDSVVQWFRDLLAVDFNVARKDIRRWSAALDSPVAGFTPDRTQSTGTYVPQKSATPFTLTNITIERILSPDTSLFSTTSGIRGAIRSATSEIDVQFMTMTKWWGSSQNDSVTTYPNMIVKELTDAGARGVLVKVILGSQFQDLTNNRDNLYTCQYLNTFTNVQCRMMKESEVGNYLHNKGFVIDGNSVIVSSINGTENSVKYARETALRLTGSTQLATYYRDLFYYDWGFATLP